MAEVRRIMKNGHSLAIVLPRKLIKPLNLKAGEICMLELVGETIAISRAKSARQLFEESAHGKAGREP